MCVRVRKNNNIPFKLRISKTCESVGSAEYRSTAEKGQTTGGISAKKANANQIMHWNELNVRHKAENCFKCHLLVKQFAYTNRIPARLSEKPNQHHQEEYDVDYENPDSVDKGPVCM
jgi:hypothetical protein